MTKLLFFLMLVLPASIAFAELQPDNIVQYKVVGDVKLSLHVFTPPGHQVTNKLPVIVFFYGGGWNAGTISHFYPQCEYFASRGMVGICADYRVKSRHQTSPAECVKDGKSAIRWIRSHATELGVDPNKLVAGGGSAGGHIAAATAFLENFNEKGEDLSISCRPNALVLFNPVFDNGPSGYGFNRVKEYWKEFSPLHNVDKNAPPTLVLLGTNDKFIPVSTATEFKSRMNTVGARCELKLYEGEPHGFFNKSKYSETISETDAFLSSLGFLR